MKRETLESSRLFLFCIALLVAGGVCWASQARIEKVVRVEGRIIPAGRSQRIQHLEGGIIAAIAVSEGSAVGKGDLLLTIDNTTAGADVSEAQVKLDAFRSRGARLDAEAAGKESIAFPPEIERLPVAAAEKELFASRKAKTDQEILVHRNLIRKHMAEEEEARQRGRQLAEELSTAVKRVAMVEAMEKNNAASRMEVLDAKSQQQRLKTAMGEAQSALPGLQAAIAAEQARIETVRSDFRAQAQGELVDTMGEIERLKQIITAAEDRLKRTEIRAPIDGVINRMSVNTVGGVVRPGDTLVELIPATSQILVEGKARPRDRGFLRPGLRASVRVSAYDTGEYGFLEGRVTEVSADSIPDPSTPGESYYQVNLLVDSVPRSYSDKALVPGMTVFADVVTGHRTMLSYLTSPLVKFTYHTFRDPK